MNIETLPLDKIYHCKCECCNIGCIGILKKKQDNRLMVKVLKDIDNDIYDAGNCNIGYYSNVVTMKEISPEELLEKKGVIVENEDLTYEEVVEYLNKEKKDRFDLYSPYDDYYIGVSFDKIQDNETGKQFKESVQEKLKEFFPDMPCGIHEEAWYNG